LIEGKDLRNTTENSKMTEDTSDIASINTQLEVKFQRRQLQIQRCYLSNIFMTCLLN